MARFLKRAICCFIVFAMCVGCASFTFAKEEMPVTDEMINAMEVLRLLDIIPDYYDYNTLFDEQVSRGDFCNVAAKLINAINNTDEELYYYDVPKTHYAYNGITALTKLNYVNGVGDKLFEPDSPIETMAAYKILLSVMGYSKYAENNGGYPAGYLKTAARLELCNRGITDGYLTRGEMLVAAYRALKTKMFEAESFKADGTNVYKISENDTILSVYHNACFEKGIVNGADMTSIDGTVMENADKVKIGSKVYKTEVSMENKLGEEVEFIYRKGRTDEENTVIWAIDTYKTDVLRLERDKIADFDKDKFTLTYYDDGDRARTIALDRGITVIYNGKEVDENTDEIFAMKDYSVKLIKTEGKYTTAIVEHYVDYVIEKTSENQKKVYDKRNENPPLELDENLYDYMTVKDSSGAKLSFAELTPGMILSVYRSLDNKYIKIITSGSRISGTVEKMRTNNGKTYLTVSGTEYEAYNDAFKKTVTAGNTVKLYIDFNGTVAYVETESGSYFAAYIVKAALDYSTIETGVMIKVFKDDGKVVVLNTAEKVKVDMEPLTKSEDILNRLSENGAIKPQFVLIRTNDEGKIKEIDTAKVNTAYGETEADSLSVNIPMQTLTYKWTGFFEGRGVINGSSVVFNVPPDSVIDDAKDADFSLKTKNDFSDGQTYTIESYKVTDRPGYEKYVLLKSKVSASYDSNVLPFLVEDVIETVNEEGLRCEALVGFQGTEKITCAAGDNVSFKNSGIEKGMVLRVAQDFYNNITNYKILFNPHEGITTQTGYQFGESFGVVLGWVYDSVDGVIKIGRNSKSIAEQFADKQGAPVLIYDDSNKNEPIISGTFDDAKTYFRDGDDAAMILMQTYYGTPHMFVIYNNVSD